MTLNGVVALFCVISANSGSFREHCVKVHVRYLVYVFAYFIKLGFADPTRRDNVLLVAVAVSIAATQVVRSTRRRHHRQRLTTTRQYRLVLVMSADS